MPTAMPLTREEPDVSAPTPRARILEHTKTSLGVRVEFPFDPARDAEVLGLTDVLAGLTPEDVPACKPFLLARDQLRAFDRANSDERKRMTADLARVEQERVEAEADLESPDLAGRLAALDAKAADLRRRITEDAGKRDVLTRIMERHRGPATSALTRRAIDQAEAEVRDLRLRHAAALHHLNTVAAEAVTGLLVLTQAVESLGKTSLADAARNFAISSL